MTLLEGLVLFIAVEHTLVNIWVIFGGPRRERRQNAASWRQAVDGLTRAMSLANITWSLLCRKMDKNAAAQAAKSPDAESGEK